MPASAHADFAYLPISNDEYMGVSQNLSGILRSPDLFSRLMLAQGFIYFAAFMIFILLMPVLYFYRQPLAFFIFAYIAAFFVFYICIFIETTRRFPETALGMLSSLSGLGIGIFIILKFSCAFLFESIHLPDPGLTLALMQISPILSVIGLDNELLDKENRSLS